MNQSETGGRFDLASILHLLPPNHRIAGTRDGFFTTIASLGQADEHSLGFVDKGRPDAQQLAEGTGAGFLIVDADVQPTEKLAAKTLLHVDDPRLTFTVIANALFVRRPSWGVHPTACLHPEAEVHPESHIGAFAHVGKAKIGRGSVVDGHVYLYDGVVIGENCTIHAGAVLGGDGYGYARQPDGFPVRFPHVGRVVLDDFVDIGANTT